MKDKNFIISAPMNMCLRNLIQSSFKINNENVFLFTDIKVKTNLLSDFGLKFKKIYSYSIFSKISRGLYFLLSSVDTTRIIKKKKWKTMSLIEHEIKNNKYLDTIIANDFKFTFNPISKFLSLDIVYNFFRLVILFFLFILSLGYIFKLLQINPKKILFLHAHSNHDKLLLFAAKILNIKSESLVHSWDNPTTKLALSIKSDKYYTWNNEIKKEMEYLNNIPSNKIFTLGILQFDSYFKSKSKVKRKKKNISIFLPSTGLVSEQNQKYFINEFLKQVNFIKFNVVIRSHPGIIFNWLKLLEKKYQNLTLNIPENIVKADKTHDIISKKDLKSTSLHKLLINTDIVINYFSTTSLDACFFEIPIINICINKKNENSLEWYYSWSHYKKLLSFKAIYVCRNLSELKNKLRSLSKKPMLKNQKAKQVKNKLIMNSNGQSGLILSKSFFNK